MIAAIQWKEVFLPSTSLLETFVRGSVVYLVLIILFRIILKREGGALSLTDLLTVVLLGDASQNAMASSHKSIGDGMFLVVTIMFWNYALDWLSFHSRWFERLLQPRPLCIIKDGQMLWRNMRRELVTEQELMSHIRQHGLEKLSEVKKAFMEGDGRITVVSYESTKTDKEPDRKGI